MPVEKDEELHEILGEVRTVAVVGASGTEGKPSHDIPAYLQERGYRIVPVNPSRDEVLGVTTVASLRDIDEHVDVVDVFRPAEETPDIARTAVEIGADVLWLQEGIVNEEAARIAEEGGLRVVMDTCMGATHQRLFAL